MSIDNIHNLENLIQKYAGPSKKVVGTSVKRLTAPGENYVSIVLKIDATLKTEDGQEEKFSAIGKCLNLDAGIFKDIVGLTYTKENVFYTEIIPTLQDFVDEMQVDLKFADIFPKLYTSRSSLDERGDNPDKNAVLLFENLSLRGFSNIDRTIGFDEKGAKLIIEDLAAFHSVPIALKLKKPDVFQNKIKKHLYRVFGGSGRELPAPPPGSKTPEDIWLEILQEYEEVKPYYKQLEVNLKASQDTFKMLAKKIPNEPFASICHADMWANNTMQRSHDDKLVENKLIDFQMYFYETVADDLIFFLFSSLQLQTIEKEFDNLVKLYHNIFIDILDKFGCDTTPFSYENLLKEIDEIAPYTFTHILFMLIAIYGRKGEAAFDISEGPVEIKKEVITDIARKRAVQLVVDFGRRGWL